MHTARSTTTAAAAAGKLRYTSVACRQCSVYAPRASTCRHRRRNDVEQRWRATDVVRPLNLTHCR